jgi:cation transport ATPase
MCRKYQRYNLLWALCYNVIALPLAAGVMVFKKKVDAI